MHPAIKTMDDKQQPQQAATHCV